MNGKNSLCPNARAISPRTISVAVAVPVLAVMLVLLTLAPALHPRPPVEKLVQQIGAEALTRDALQAHGQHVRAHRGLAEDVPDSMWGEALRRLHPLWVYLHRANVVVVLQATNGTEQGLYITTLISSYAPRDGDEGFAFAPVAKDVFRFTRRSPTWMVDNAQR